MTTRTLKKPKKYLKVIKLNGWGLVNEETKKVGVIHMQGGTPFGVELKDGQFEVGGLKFKHDPKDPNQKV